MDTRHDEAKEQGTEVLGEIGKHTGNICTAYNEKKWWRLLALIIFSVVMVAFLIFAKPLLAAYLLKCFTGIGWLPLPVCKGAASCVTKGIITQLRNIVKRWILKIDR